MSCCIICNNKSNNSRGRNAPVFILKKVLTYHSMSGKVRLQEQRTQEREEQDMANKILNHLNDWMRWHDEGRAKTSEILEKESELSDLVYKMWQNDLISDNEKDECYKVLQDFGWKWQL